ncbi:MAG: ATP-dependent helicase [Sideroxyarcus sp.]|nr:ATP-dependent helicase [Sideroxyarcus sp.]
MTITICEKRQQILDATGHVLVLGGPGSGKTTIALKKAVRLIDEGLQPGQAILFLSFSRSAVARIGEASKTEVEKSKRHQLSVQTFHSFCWELLRSHGYLVGCPKRRLELLMPHDERALSGGLKPPQKGQAPSVEWRAWQNERQRLFSEEGKITFDLFASKSVELLSRCPLILELVADRYPVIVVDEAQDTGSEAWRCIEILSSHTQVICLGDLEQQIFDHLEGVGPERIVHIQEALQPLRVDLGNDNNRSPGTEIAKFANDILGNLVRGTPYVGVSRQMYDPKGDATKRLRIALVQVYRSVKKATGKWPESIAVLAPVGAGVARISAALNGGIKPVRHKVLFDEAVALLSARFAAFLLEPKVEENLRSDMAKCLEMLAAIRRVAGSKAAIQEAAKYLKWSLDIVQGKTARAQLPVAIEAIVNGARTLQLTGDPGRDWTQIKRLMRESGQTEISRIVGDLDYLIAFNRGKRISANLSAMWIAEGAYVRAREALDAALVEDQLLAGMEDLRGIHVMTIHKSKGKQFDAVIIVREGQRLGAFEWRSTLVWRDDPAPYNRSRKILRVGITRAKVHVLMLEPFYPPCPILTPHTL